MFARWARRDVMAVDHRPPVLHLNVPDGPDEYLRDLIVDALVGAVDPVTRARLGDGPHVAVLDAMQDDDTYPDGWQQMLSDAVNTVLEEAFPRVVPDDADVTFATMVSVASLAAIGAAGLPVDGGRLADVTRTVLVSMQEEVAG